MLLEILLIAACIVFLLLLSFALHHQSSKALFTHIESIKTEITPPGSTFKDEIEDFREDILDLVHETISKMQPPNAIDHLMGALVHPIQAWAMRKAGIDPATGGPIVEQIAQMAED